MKTKIYFTILLIGVGLIVVGLVNKNNNSDLADVKNDEFESDTMDDGEIMSDKMTTANFLEGVLHNTDDLSQGNFKLIAEEGDIYIRTTRDFSNLIGRQVLVSIDGTFENFELVDIQSKVEDDGFIISQ